MNIKTTKTTWWLTVAAVFLSFAFLACDDAEDTKKKPEDNLPPAKVDLPPIPADLGQSSTPEKLADGSLTVRGVFRQRMALLDKPITVTGFVDWIYNCPHWEDRKKKRRRRKKKKKGEEEEKLCERPHFYITDKPDAKPDEEDKLLVVGLGEYIHEELFQEGKIKLKVKHTFTGNFADLGDGFAAPDKGLLILTKIKGMEEPVDDKK